MAWVFLLVILTLVMLFYLIEFFKAKNKFNQMVAVDGQLLSYQLNANSRRPFNFKEPYDKLASEHIFTQITVHYKYEFNGEDYESRKLSLLPASKKPSFVVNSVSTPMSIKVFIDKDNPDESTLYLGRFSILNVLSALVAFTLSAVIIFKNAG